METKQSKGFTIIEVVISIFILSIAIVGIFAAFSVMAILTSDSSDQLTATYLAQEGLEIVRNIRDTNWVKMNGAGCDCTPGVNCIEPDTCAYNWDDQLKYCEASGCEVDYTTGTNVSGAFSVKPWSARWLYNNQTTGFYDYDVSGTQSRFKRRVIIEPVTDLDNKSDHILKVTVQVSWNKKATILLDTGISADNCELGRNCVQSEVTLYNWYNYVNQ